MNGTPRSLNSSLPNGELVTISRISTKKYRFGASIRWKILLAFFVIVGVSFAVAATNLTGLVREYLFDQREREDSLLTEKAAAEIADAFGKASAEELNRILADNAKAMNGRLMVIDRDGKVQFDTFGSLCGRRIQQEEVLQVLMLKKNQAYGVYTPGQEETRRMSGEENADHVAYSVHKIGNETEPAGALLYVSRIQELVDSLETVQWRLIRVFAVIVLAALLLALFLSQVLTKPITDLSRTMRKMGKGDLSVRATVRGSGELRELAENYNTMASQLEQQDKTRNQFVSNASHELRTPLTTMKIMLETVMYQPEMPDDLRMEFMQDMNHEIDRLTGIVTDLLTLTRMDNRNEKLQLETVDMSVMTEETIRLLTQNAEKRHQQLSGNITPGLTMEGDRSKLNQILYNLTENAIKYTPDNGHILVSLSEENDQLIWKVKDDGVGIPEEDQPHIFERFYRVDKARSRETGGTGLGLSIVKQLVNMHGGTITVESKAGNGSEFTVTLPRKGAAA